MPERTFIAPEAGHYHVGTGLDPHLIRDCTAACAVTSGGPFVAEPSSYLEVTFDTYAITAGKRGHEPGSPQYPDSQTG